jgi:hypothetical protein
VSDLTANVLRLLVTVLVAGAISVLMQARGTYVERAAAYQDAQIAKGPEALR